MDDTSVVVGEAAKDRWGVLFHIFFSAGRWVLDGLAFGNEENSRASANKGGQAFTCLGASSRLFSTPV